MAIVIATRIQDDFSSTSRTISHPIALTSYDHPTDEDLSAGTPVEHGPQVARYGLRTDGPIFRADLSAAVPTHANEAQTVYNLDFIAACALLHKGISTRLQSGA